MIPQLIRQHTCELSFVCVAPVVGFSDVMVNEVPTEIEVGSSIPTAVLELLPQLVIW